MIERLTSAEEDGELVAEAVAHEECVAVFTFETDDLTVQVLVEDDDGDDETVDE